ncbi:uncharacterized protein PHALS_09317 [Plasmopara halstedii]|uniref:Uncharacterized protein n=1 Tax=Plasmopara halstedii TaxID=4781 RepID=A0A0P1AFQ3_PLAHL|nr:uncharacterized protein PHALS_09317 [Plasmopara halstedii]CEG39265.1 hypothetical protein PHALS_09317 [Plasmopara halstedii]|eukprot:XP_024575634.1 hypothetical protein PHALS_09317 [Plasmopara halstedii]
MAIPKQSISRESALRAVAKCSTLLPKAKNTSTKIESGNFQVVHTIHEIKGIHYIVI